MQALIAFPSANRGANSTRYPSVEDVPVGTVHALSPVEARPAGALIQVGFAEAAKEARGAGAGEAPQGVAAGPAVQARLGRALIYFQLTVFSFKSKENKQTPDLADTFGDLTRDSFKYSIHFFFLLVIAYI